eukprot:895648_1
MANSEFNQSKMTEESDSSDDPQNHKMEESDSSDDPQKYKMNIHHADIHPISDHNDLVQNEESLPQPPVKPTPVAVDNYNPEDNTGKIVKRLEDARPWWHKDHCILLCMFLLNVFDFITDVQVAKAIINLDTNVCPQFNCSVRVASDLKHYGERLIIFASIGFAYTLIRNALNAKKYVIFYKKQIVTLEEEQVKWNRYKRDLYWGWIPLTFENCLSILTIFTVWSGNYKNVVESNRTVYHASFVLSCISVIVTLIILWIKRRHLSNSKEHQKQKVYTKALCCHCCWCVCIVIGIFYLSFMVSGSIFFEDASPVVVISGRPDGQCWFYELDHIFRGDIIGYPQWIYDGCDGIDYMYDLQCAKDKDEETILLHCELNWNFTAHGDNFNDSYCHQLGDVCGFDLNVGTCRNYTITCD